MKCTNTWLEYTVNEALEFNWFTNWQLDFGGRANASLSCSSVASDWMGLNFECAVPQTTRISGILSFLFARSRVFHIHLHIWNSNWSYGVTFHILQTQQERLNSPQKPNDAMCATWDLRPITAATAIHVILARYVHFRSASALGVAFARMLSFISNPNSTVYQRPKN